MAYAIITGASGGIGLCIARELAARKYDLLLVARSEKKLSSECNTLQQKYGVQAAYLAIDLSERSAADVVIQWIDTNGAQVEVFINNAGYGLWGPVETANLGGLWNMVDLNIGTLMALSQRIIPYLRRKTPSYLMNVASTAAYQAVPTLSTYAASKSFVVLFTRGLRWELRSSGISVSCLSPGATSTGFIDRAGLEKLKDRAEKFSMTAEEVARIGVRKMFQGKAEIVPGFMNWISVKLTYFFPKALIEKIAASLYE